MSYGVAAYADFPLYGLPVAVFDFETTGVDPTSCKAVELAIVHCNLGKDNAEVVFEKRFNPGCHIPEGASSVCQNTQKRYFGCWMGGFWLRIIYRMTGH